LVRAYNEEHEEGERLASWVPAQRLIKRGVLGVSARGITFLYPDHAGQMKSQHWPHERIGEIRSAESLGKHRLNIAVEQEAVLRLDVAQADAEKFLQAWSAAAGAKRPAPASQPPPTEPEEKRERAEREDRPARRSPAVRKAAEPKRAQAEPEEKPQESPAPGAPAGKTASRTAGKTKPPPAERTPADAVHLDDETRRLLAEGRQIQALERIRKKHGLGAIEARELVAREARAAGRARPGARKQGHKPDARATLARLGKRGKELRRRIVKLNGQLDSPFTPHTGVGCLSWLIAVGAGIAIGQTPAWSAVGAVGLGLLGFVFFGFMTELGNAWYFRINALPELNALMADYDLTPEELLAVAHTLFKKPSAPLPQALKKHFKL